MKHLYYLCFIVFLSSSCTPLVFKQSQPQKAKLLHQFPEELQGSYIDDKNDTLVVGQTSFMYGDINTYVHLDEKLMVGKTELKKTGDFYVLNMVHTPDVHPYWVVIPCILEDEQIRIFMLDIEEVMDKRNIEEAELLAEINSIVPIEKIEMGENKMSYAIDPSAKEFETLLAKGYFTEVGQLKKIK